VSVARLPQILDYLRTIRARCKTTSEVIEFSSYRRTSRVCCKTTSKIVELASVLKISDAFGAQSSL
jgi:hypothetical protein